MIKNASLLMTLAEAGALSGWVTISSPILSKRIGAPQQSVSRWLKSLEVEGFIQREVSRRGQKIVITDKGRKILEHMYAKLKVSFEGMENTILITGTVTTGLKEGRYYMSIPPYKNILKKELGFESYPGTLNLKLITAEDQLKRNMLDSRPGILIEPQYYQGRKLLSAKCFHAKINGKVDGAVIIPERTHHGKDILEVISRFYLRKKLNIKDGDKISVQVKLNG
jgi:riboflavin kinase